MKKRSTKKTTPAAIKRALANAGLEAKGIKKVTPAKVVKVSKTYKRQQARRAERVKARLTTVPKKYQAALKRYGLGAAQNVISRRGRYYTGAGVYNINRFGLAVKKREVVQNVYAWKPADRRGWYIRVVNGVPQKRLARWADVQREQKAAWRQEKIRVVGEKTGLTKAKVREILAIIRKEEGAKLARFKRTKKYAALSAKEKKRYTIARRVQAVFGALCDLLEIYGSPKTKPD